MFPSDDLECWEFVLLLEIPGYGFFTSFTRDWDFDSQPSSLVISIMSAFLRSLRFHAVSGSLPRLLASWILDGSLRLILLAIVEEQIVQSLESIHTVFR